MGAKSFVRGLTLGAGLMYLMDSERGRARREQLAQQVSHLLGSTRYRFDTGGFEGGVEIGHYGARDGDIAGLGALQIDEDPVGLAQLGPVIQATCRPNTTLLVHPNTCWPINARMCCAFRRSAVSATGRRPKLT